MPDSGAAHNRPDPGESLMQSQPIACHALKGRQPACHAFEGRGIARGDLWWPMGPGPRIPGGGARKEQYMSRKMGARAVVIGASIGGLTAAQVLADRFEKVFVIERDLLPDEAAHRDSIPQGRHVHVLLAGGERALSELFPGFADELIAAGAVPYRPGLDVPLE